MTPRERLFALEQFGIKLGLDNITALLSALGRPDRQFACVHVGGTNGKGSVTAMVERGLRAAGYRTGRYTSPHLCTIEERIAIDGMPVDAVTFDAVTAEVLSVVDDLHNSGTLPHLPTFFEVTTAIAFEMFRRATVEVAVIEVGLGGRFDATNVITPVVTAITSIARDHERYLGTTFSAIAFEKAGIIKPNVPVVIGPMHPDAAAVIARVARERGAPLVAVAPADEGEPVPIVLNGPHQRVNAAIAVEVLRRGAASGALSRPVRREHIVSALTDVEWPARLEWLRLTSGDLLIDAAHNPAGAAALADYIGGTTGPMPMVIGVMRDKDVAAIVRALAPAVSRFIATAVPSSSRALPADELTNVIRAQAPDVPCDRIDDAMDALTAALGGGNRKAAIAGSIFLVGPVRGELLARGAKTVRYPSNTPFYLS